ncbi:response regulator [Mucilaginibacter jinjuensis]|uniref:Response regulator n=1 Tax=Mucilaginibacter jinjuensis TaxID=1176721 RepID=A0ABY7TA33_9SPHI|nr:response regulator [Mucilaginibacter jinjuensis]WCT13196.1 response regulator [Mucilaginibacter jinjuensis]
MKILVIEDNKDILEVLNIILTDDGYEVISCDDGTSIDNLKNINPGLILMDELLPSVKGSELCLRVKNDDELKHIPVILISAAQSIESIAGKCGADAYVAKPFDIELLSNLVKSLIG